MLLCHRTNSRESSALICLPQLTRYQPHLLCVEMMELEHLCCFLRLVFVVVCLQPFLLSEAGKQGRARRASARRRGLQLLTAGLYALQKRR